LISKWPGLTPRLRSEATRVLLRRSAHTLSLLQSIGQGKIRQNVLSSNQIRFLKNHRSKNVRAVAGRVLDSKPAPAREEVMESFRPALSLRGNVGNGAKIFAERCASCHRLGSSGHAVGPDLATMKNAGREELLAHIIDPNLEVDPTFLNYTVERADGESSLGIVVQESAAGVTLRQPFGVETVIRRSMIRSMKSDGRSAMPEGLESELSLQAMADLLEFLLNREGLN